MLVNTYSSLYSKFFVVDLSDFTEPRNRALSLADGCRWLQNGTVESAIFKFASEFEQCKVNNCDKFSRSDHRVLFFSFKTTPLPVRWRGDKERFQIEVAGLGLHQHLQTHMSSTRSISQISSKLTLTTTATLTMHHQVHVNVSHLGSWRGG